MNNDIAISVRNISKAYTIRHNAEQHTMLSEAIMHTLRNPLRRQEKETFWALKDINFDVKKGDVVGIIGRNGAGKSTLLKILSRITEPTTGEILMDGRVGSLLEVGTGFHPELTGRENIYLNGAILGMKRREIDRKFDEIVDFAGVEQFLDTPVKRYSSGMYVRLAFAVAAHLNPEILIVDEVLSVGDAEFQKKCLGKMGEVAKSGRTVLFVSHNMAAVKALCTIGILMNNGKLSDINKTNNIISQYTYHTSSKKDNWHFNEYGFCLSEICFIDKLTGLNTEIPIFNSGYYIKLKIYTKHQFNNASIVCRIHDESGNLISTSCSLEEGVDSTTFSKECIAIYNIDNLQLFPNKYFLTISVCRANDPIVYLHEEDALEIRVQPDHVNNGAWSYSNKHGFVRIVNGVKIITDESINIAEMEQSINI